MLLVAGSVSAAGPLTVTPIPSGTTGISIDTTSAPGGTGTWTGLGTLSGPVITEQSLGQLTVGFHSLVLPSGWEFNTAQNVTIGLNGLTELTLGASVVTPSANTITFHVTAPSLTVEAVLTFSDMQVRPTGTTVSSADGYFDFGTYGTLYPFGTFSTGPGVATQYSVTDQNAGTEIAGVSFSMTLNALDQFGNIVGGQNGGANDYNVNDGAILWSSTATDPSPNVTFITLPGPGGAIFSHGVVTVSGFTLTTSGESPTITATGAFTATSPAITVYPGATATFTLQSVGPSQFAGTSNQLIITAKDVDGNMVDSGPNAQSSYAITFSGASTIGLYVPTVTDDTGTAINFGTPTTIDFTTGTSSAGGSMVLYTAEAAAISATDGAITSNTLPVSVNPAAAASFGVVTQNAGTEMAGTAFSVTLTALDTYGNVVSSGFNNYNGSYSVAWTSNATASPNSTTPILAADGSQTFVNGVVTVSGFTLYNAGETPTITATAGAVAGTTAAITVYPDVAASFTVVNHSANIEIAGVSFSVTVTALDAYGNIVNAGPNNYTGPHTVNWSWTGAGANISPNGTLPVLPVDGSQTFSDGTVTVSGFTLTNAGDTPTITATDTVISGTSLVITVDPGATINFAITGTSPKNAGAANLLGITAKDVDGNVVSSGINNYNGDKLLTFSGAATIGLFVPTVTDKTAAPVNFGTATTITFTNGVSSAGGSMVLYKAETASITATASAGAITTPVPLSVIVNSLAASKFVITGAAGQVAGTANALSITETDAYGNIKTGFTGDVALTFSGANTINGNIPTVTDKTSAPVNFGTATTITFTAGVSSAGGSMVLYKAESASISATAAGITTLTPLAVTVTPAVAASYTVTTPGTKTAGTAFSVTLTALDAYTNVVSSGVNDYNAVDGITWTTSATNSPNTTPPTLAGNGPQTFVHGVVTVGGFTLVNSGETPTITAAGAFTATSAAITVQPGVATTFSITGGATQTAGTPNALTITAKDADGNVVSFGTNDFSGTYGLSFSGASPINGHNPTVTDSLGAPTAFGTNTGITFTNGVSSAGGSMVLYQAGGPFSISAATFGITCLVPLSVTVNPAAAAAFTVAAASGTQVAGTPNALTITAIDTYGNTDTAYAGVKSLTFTGASTIGGYHPTVTDNGAVAQNFGVAENITFTGGISTAGGSMVLYMVETPSITATAGAVAGTSTAITVTPAAAASYTVTTEHSGLEVAGVPFSVTLTAFDTYGNAATTDNSPDTITWTTSATASPNTTLPTLAADGSQTFASGVVTVPGFTLTNAAETPTITATGSLSGVSAAITVQPGAAATFTITGTTPKNAGVANLLGITAKDVDGNVVSSGVNDYNGDYALTFSGASTIGLYVPTVTDKTTAPVNFGTPTTITFTNGVMTAGGSMVLYKAETASITATDGVVTTPVPFVVVVNPGAAAKLGLSASLTSLAAGTTTTLTTSEQDTYGNAVTTDSTSYVIFSVDGHGTYVPHQVQVTAGVGTTVVSDTTAETIHVSVMSNPWMTPPADVSITFTGFAVAITAPGAGATVSGASVPVTFTTNGGATTAAQISIDGGAFSLTGITNANPGTYTLDTTGLTNGTHTIQVKDTVGGITSYSPTFGVIVNNTVTMVITTPTSGQAVSGSLTIAATTNGGANTAAFYQIDGGTWTAIATAWNTTTLTDGSHTVQVKDTVGTVTGYSGNVTVVVNNNNTPTFSFTTPAPGTTLAYTTTTTGTYTVSNFDASTVQYSVNGGAWTAAGDASQAGIAVQVGTNTLQLKATKTVGGVTTTGYSAIDTFIVSAQGGPAVVITNPTAGQAVSGSLTIAATTNGGANTAAFYQIDGGSWIAIATAWNTTTLANGSHTIQVKDTVASVTGYSTTIVAVVNNGNTPTFTFTAPASGTAIANASSVAATYTVTNFTTGSVMYSVNGGTWTAAGDAGQSIPVVVGINTIQLLATKTVGGVTTTGYSAIDTFTVNAVSAPVVVITNPTAGQAVSGSLTIAATTNGGANTAAFYQIDGGTWTAIATAWNTTTLANGSHTIQVKDTVAAVTGYSTTITVIVNNGNTPAFSFNNPIPGTSIANTTAVTANYTVSNFDTGTVKYSINGSTWTTAADATQSIPVMVGINTIQLLATKTVGGVTTTGYSAIDTFTVNAVGAPVVVITAPAAGLAVSGTTSVTFTTNSGITTAAQISIDGGAFSAGGITNANPGTYSWNTTTLANGSHTIQVKDTVASVTGYSTTITVVVNNGNTPAFSFTTPAPGTAIANAATVTSTYTVSNFDTGTVKYSVNGGAWTAALDASQAGIAVHVGINTLQLLATKTVGGVTTTGYSAIDTFTVNALNAPVEAIAAPAAGATVSGTTTVTFTTNGGATTAAFVSIDGGTYVAATTNANPGTYSWNTVGLTNGTHTIQVMDTVSGVAGYSSIVSVTTNNAVTFSGIAVTGITSTSATITWNTNANSTGNSVAYGNTYTLSSTQTASGSGATAHTATLTGLTLNTTYYFQLTSSVGGQAATTDVYSFTTAPSNSGIAVSIQTIKSFAVADGSFTNGWEFKFTITDNVTTDTQLQMKFNDWLGSSGAFAANGNMKIALDDNVAGVQAGTDGVTVGNAYGNALTITDQNPNVGGLQTVIFVYVSVPGGTSGGSFSTNYGIHTY